MNYHELGLATSFHGEVQKVKIGKWLIAVFHIDGKFYAIKDACPHQEVSLSTGTVRGTTLTCPGHVWEFDLRTGQCIGGGETEISAKTFPVKVEDGLLFVAV